jgi:cell division septation protein DedD
MGVLKTLLGVVILVAIGVIGYWLYATYTIASADDEFWVKVNSNMPAPLRHWSCGQVKARVNTPQAPEGCTDAWQASVAPQSNAGQPAEPMPSASSDYGTPPADTPAEPLTPPAEPATGAAKTN